MAWESLEDDPVAVGVRPAWECLAVVREEDIVRPSCLPRGDGALIDCLTD